MSSNKPMREGYNPATSRRGWQPKPTAPGDPKPQGGYQPTGTGDNPANVPSPPKKD